MRQRIVLYGLLAVVATAAAVLSFAALRDLAILCGFDPWLAWLLPVVVDAGAAAGSLAWLGSAAPTARGYGRALALTLLTLSVGGNALGHGLAAYGLAPHWLVVVAVSAVPPAVLGALVHLVVLAVRQPASETATRLVADLVAEQPDALPATLAVTLPATPGEIDAGDPATVPMAISPAPATEDVAPPATRPALHLAPAVADDVTTPPAGVEVAGDGEGGENEVAKAQRLLAEGAGRPTLARQLDLKPHQARALLERPDEVATLLPRWRARQATNA